METLPFYISAVFVLTTFLTVIFFYKATNGSKKVLAIILSWLAIQAVPSINGFYTITDTLPPRFILLIGPPLLLFIVLFATKSGRKFIDSLNIRYLTILHSIRIVVELVLFWLFVQKAVPQIMTFEGRNLDILSGITALVVFYFAFIKKSISNRILLLWNILCLGLLINIVTIAILSAPFPFQQLALDQPNIGILYFPFTWLPACVVPLVLFSHLSAIRQLLKNVQKTASNNTILAG